MRWCGQRDRAHVLPLAILFFLAPGAHLDLRVPWAAARADRARESGLTKRKILSINSRTSCLFTSRKYSAIVSAVKPTRIRAPGGSFICPYTSATLDSVSLSSLITLDSFISQ